MRTTLLKGAAGTLAPKAARAIFRSRKNPFERATDWATGAMHHRRRHDSAAMTAAKGLGAAALAIPVGMWLGRRMRAGE